MSTETDTERTTNRLRIAARELGELPEVELAEARPGGAKPTVRLVLRGTSGFVQPVPEPVMREVYEHGLGVFRVKAPVVSATPTVER